MWFWKRMKPAKAEGKPVRWFQSSLSRQIDAELDEIDLLVARIEERTEELIRRRTEYRA